MKIIFLNIWNGQVEEHLKEFILREKEDTDVFCFQEVYEKGKTLLSDILSDFSPIVSRKPTEKVTYGQATYIKNNIEILTSEDLLTSNPKLGLAQAIKIKKDGEEISLCNIHGQPYPGKEDTPERLLQSKEIVKYFSNIPGKRIIGGDLNVLPETKSVKMFSESGYKDLIHDFDIKTTRNRLVWELFPDNILYYSDYIFASPEVIVTNFSVIENEISDHLPMILIIE